MRLAKEGDVWSLLLLEHDCSQRHLLANEFVEGQELLSAVLNSLPLSHPCLTSFREASLAS